MKTLILTTLFVCAFGLVSIAQEKSEKIEKEPIIHTSKKTSKNVFPSAVERKESERKTNDSKGKTEASQSPAQKNKISDPKLVEDRKKEKQSKVSTNKTFKKTLEKRKAENNK